MRTITKLKIAFLVFLITLPASFANTELKNSPDADCPVEQFYRGYDLTRGNPVSDEDGDGSDPGWQLAIFTSESDADCFTCTAVESCSGSYSFSDMDIELDYYLSLYEMINVSESSEDFLISTAFTGSAEYTYQQQNIFGLQLVNVQAHGACQLFEGGRDPYCTGLAFSSGFLNAVEGLPISFENPNWFEEGVRPFFVTYGTHMIAENVSLGARWTYESVFSQINYEALREKSVNIDAAAEASAEFFRTNGKSAAYESAEVKQMRIDFENARKEATPIYVGALPPEELNFGEWANNIENPIPQKFNLAPISEILTRDFFPDDPMIYKKREVLEAGYFLYCDTVPGCHVPKQPKIMHVKEKGEGKYPTKNDATASCPAGYQLVAGGCDTEFADNNKHWLIPALKPVENNSYYCMNNMDYSQNDENATYKGVTAIATCMRNDLIQDVQIVPCTGPQSQYGSECIAKCSPGYHVTGGGCESEATHLDFPWKVTSSRPVYSGDGVWNAWSCKVGEDYKSAVYHHKALGYAICAQYAENVFIDQETIGDWSGTQGQYKNGLVLSCEPGYEILSGGCTAEPQSNPNQEWKVIETQPSSYHSWSCQAAEDLDTRNYNQDVQAEALCVRLNDNKGSK